MNEREGEDETERKEVGLESETRGTFYLVSMIPYFHFVLIDVHGVTFLVLIRSSRLDGRQV